MARMKFLCDTKRCIECNGCVTACKNENDDALELSRVKTRSLLRVCTVPMHRVWQFAPQFPKQTAFGERGKMDKCTFCAGGPETEVGSEEERKKYGANRIAEGKLPMCAFQISSVNVLLSVAQKVLAGPMVKIFPMTQQGASSLCEI